MSVATDTRTTEGWRFRHLAGAFLAGLALGAVSFAVTREAPAPPAPIADARPGPPSPFGHWRDEPMPWALVDYVEFYFQTPEGCAAERELRTLVEPLIIAARGEHPPDFIRLDRTRFGKVVQELPRDFDHYTAAVEALNTHLERGSRGPAAPRSEAEWSAEVAGPMHLLPPELAFLRTLPTREGTFARIEPGVKPTVERGQMYAGSGNSAAVERALEYLRGKRKGVRQIRPPVAPRGPGP